MAISAPNRPNIPIYVSCYAEGEVTNHIMRARTKTEEKKPTEGLESPKKINSVRYPFYFAEKNYSKKSLEGKFQNKLQTAVSMAKSTVKTDTGKILNRIFISEPIFLTERRTRKKPAINTSHEINPNFRHCLRGLDGKYGPCDEILRDILKGK